MVKNNKKMGNFIPKPVKKDLGWWGMEKMYSKLDGDFYGKKKSKINKMIIKLGGEVKDK